MAQVTVMIDGKAYRMACNDGEEQHLESLAAHYDGRIQELRTTFGEIGDMRLAVMAAITVTDEMAELRQRLQRAEADLASAKVVIDGFERERRAADAQTASTVAALADRIERLAKTLHG